MKSVPQDNVSQPFLLEIGSEEIPARFIPASMADLERLFVAEMEKAHLQVEGVQVWATPRRLVLKATALAVRQPDRQLEIKGPPVKVAFDADGLPTKAALGFARKAGISLDDCERAEDQRGEFLLARVQETGRPAAEVLGEVLPGVILGIPFRKRMRWGSSDLEYPRPLKWILALLGEAVVKISIGDIESGRVTRGHRTLANDAALVIASPARYEEALSEAGVVVDPVVRRERIAAGLADVLQGQDPDARLLVDDELLTEVVFLCEHPTPFSGTFSSDYAALPDEVITTALKSHQRYFSVGSRSGEGLVTRFAAVRDGGDDHLAGVVRGNERVLHARLADALFYWTFDQQKTPDERTEMLASVTWLEGFGSVLDKTARLGKLVVWLWENGMGDGQDVPVDLVRAAHLAKSDLVSEMIRDGKEFTKLEGFIGARYASLAGESDQVCRSIEGHYAPRSATGHLPDDRQAAVLSVADRLDNVAGCWLAGFVPTGAKDPYALRRHVLAVIRILLAESIELDLEAALHRSFDGLAALAESKGGLDVAAARDAAALFVRTRLEGYLMDQGDENQDVVRAVLPVRWRNPVDASAWVRALDGYREQADFQLLATGFKRCRNILKGEVLPVEGLLDCRQRWLAGGLGAAGEDFSGLPDPLEAALLAQVVAAVPQLVAAESARDYQQVFAVLSGLGPAIDAFFEGVRVNAEEETLRRLRHGFLREIHGLFAQYADFGAVAPGE